MSSTSKRSRVENIGDENTPEESSSAFSQEILGNGDTEIFSTLIPLMRNLNVLKTCRLVCKSWNQFACLALRKLPWVFHRFYEGKHDDGDACLTLILKNKSLGLPSPFGNFKILLHDFREERTLRFLKYLRDNVNNYSIHLYIFSGDTPNADPAELQRILTSNLHNFKITKLVLSGDIFREGADIESFQPENIRLPHLKMLGINYRGLTNDKMVTLCESICLYSPLKNIRIADFTSGEKLKRVMAPGGLKSVERFYLNCEQSISPGDWISVCVRIMKIPCIKNLRLYYPQADDTYNWYYKGFAAAIHHFADSLEFLTGAYLPIFYDKCFPKLREINESKFNQFDSDFSYPVERYPLLKKVTFGNCKSNALDYPSVEQPSPGIEELCFKAPAVEDPDLILKFICGAGMVFPNIFKFSIVQSGDLQFTTAMLSVICNSFPKLSALELQVNLKDHRTLSGLRLIVDEWLQEGWPFEKIPREASLLDIQGLEELTLGPQVVISRHLFLYCLSKIPKLKYLTFYLNGDVSAADVRKSVGHLTRVTVVNLLGTTNPEKKWVKEMERLQKMLPSVVEIKEKVF